MSLEWNISKEYDRGPMTEKARLPNDDRTYAMERTSESEDLVETFVHASSSSSVSVMLTTPRPHEAEVKTHKAKAEAVFFGLKAEAEFEAKFMSQQRFEKPPKM